MDEALKRLPQDVVDARNQRLRRAADLNMKHSELPKELQQLQTPFELYVKDTLDVSWQQWWWQCQYSGRGAVARRRAALG